MTKIFIDGKAGTTGLRIYERLEKRNDIEIIVIDDGSEDNKWKSLLNYRNSHSNYMNLILLWNEENKGVGMDYSKTYPVGDYTFKFDFYALEIGSNKNIVAHLTAPNWSGDAYPYGSGQKWLEIEEKLNEWQTISFDVTTVKDGQFPWFYIGAGLKGYFDNYQIIDKKTGKNGKVKFEGIENGKYWTVEEYSKGVVIDE